MISESGMRLSSSLSTFKRREGVLEIFDPLDYSFEGTSWLTTGLLR